MSRFLLILTCALLINHVDSGQKSKNITVETPTVDDNSTKNSTNLEGEVEENKKAKQELVEAVVAGQPPPPDFGADMTDAPWYIVLGAFAIVFLCLGVCVLMCIGVRWCIRLSERRNQGNQTVQINEPAGSQASVSNSKARGYRGRGNNNGEGEGLRMEPVRDSNFLTVPEDPRLSRRGRTRSSPPVHSGATVPQASSRLSLPTVLSSGPVPPSFLQERSATVPPASPPATGSGAESGLPTVSQDEPTTVPTPNSSAPTVYQSTSSAELPTDTESPTVSQDEPTTDDAVSETTAVLHADTEESNV